MYSGGTGCFDVSYIFLSPRLMMDLFTAYVSLSAILLAGKNVGKGLTTDATQLCTVSCHRLRVLMDTHD